MHTDRCVAVFSMFAVLCIPLISISIRGRRLNDVTMAGTWTSVLIAFQVRFDGRRMAGEEEEGGGASDPPRRHFLLFVCVCVCVCFEKKKEGNSNKDERRSSYQPSPTWAPSSAHRFSAFAYRQCGASTPPCLSATPPTPHPPPHPRRRRLHFPLRRPLDRPSPAALTSFR